jgi:hypothetical protein
VNALSTMQASSIVQHQHNAVHRLATRLFMQPDLPRAELFSGYKDDVELMRGNVPQPEDWLRVWRACKTPISFSAAEKVMATEDYIASSVQVNKSVGSSGSCGSLVPRLRTAKVKRRSMRQLVLIFQEVIRIRKRIILRAARSISLSLDDRAAFRLVRFRCDTSPAALKEAGIEVADDANGFSCNALKFEGLLSVLRVGGIVDSNQLENHDGDKSQRAADSIMEELGKFCTPMGSSRDEELYQHIVSNIRHFLADQCAGVQKTGSILSDSMMPNIQLIGKDESHQVRIAAKDPLHAQSRFGEQWDRLFGDKHALVPDIQNSDVWKAELIACQKRVLEQKGEQGGGLQKLMKHFSFAKQRFDSEADPLLRYCAMLRAIAMLLAFKAADERNKPEIRERAQKALEHMVPEELVALGLTADYTQETLEFLRQFDTDDHDPATTAILVRQFVRRLRLLFVDGHILVDQVANVAHSANAAHSCAASSAARCITATQMVMDQILDEEPIFYGKKLFLLHSRATPQQVKRVLHDMQDVVAAATDRLLEDLAGDQFKASLEAFNLQSWASASQADADERQEKELLKKAAIICGAFEADRAKIMVSVGKFGQAAKFLARRSAAAAKLHGSDTIDNRVAWSWLLQPAWVLNQNQKFIDHARVLEMPIRFYLSIRSGTGTVERQLGMLLRVLESHSGPLSEDGHTAEALAEVLLDGPAKEEDLFYKESTTTAAGKKWLLTDFSRECYKCFIQHHGRRFLRTYKTTSGSAADSAKSAKRKSGQQVMHAVINYHYCDLLS